MKLSCAAVLLAVSAVLALPAAEPLDRRAVFNPSVIRQIIRSESDILERQAQNSAELRRAKDRLGSMSGGAITAALVAHQRAIDAQATAIRLTRAANAGLERMV
ncbi:hypothetical protein H4R19_000421 [Coemansia spiralis]|nr:hypothetical protein H4R19_000421 [Coemansia spiralis]